EGLARHTGKVEVDRAVGHTLVAVTAGNFAADAGSDGTITVGNGVVKNATHLVFDSRHHFTDHLLRQRALVERLVFRLGAELWLRVQVSVSVQYRAQIKILLTGSLAGEDLQQVDAADQVLQAL